ncbi:hypothetical protein GTY84_07925 [Streptomyces sp. SID8352]|nr:hypothetical protein [Streptomyces sp. SID8352]
MKLAGPAPAAPSPLSTSASSNLASRILSSPPCLATTGTQPPADRRRHRILGLLEEDPTHLWSPRDIASHFGDITMETMYRQLSRWAETGLIHRLGPGLCAATKWTSTPLA